MTRSIKRSISTVRVEKGRLSGARLHLEPLLIIALTYALEQSETYLDSDCH